jgi:hypothetical protein
VETTKHTKNTKEKKLSRTLKPPRTKRIAGRKIDDRKMNPLIVSPNARLHFSVILSDRVPV